MEIDIKSNQNSLNSQRLSSGAVTDFQSIYFKKYGVKISSNEAERLGMNLLRLFSAVYKPIKKDLYEK